MFIMLAVRSIAEILYVFIRQLRRLYPFGLSTEHCADICIVAVYRYEVSMFLALAVDQNTCRMQGILNKVNLS